jgi:hypothetical protein
LPWFHRKKIPGIRAALDKFILTETQLQTFYGREAKRHLSDAETYLKEAETLNPKIEQIVKKNDYANIRTIEKAMAYIDYADKIVKVVEPLLEKAAKTKPLEPVQPEPVAFSPQANAAYAAHPRAEIILNGIWEHQGGPLSKPVKIALGHTGTTPL